MPLKSPHSEPKKRLQPNTKPCLQCAWAGQADSCQYRHRTLSCERCVELKDILQCSGVKGLYADNDDLDVPTFLKDVYADMMRRNKLESDRERRLNRLERKVDQALKALGFEGRSDEDGDDEEDVEGESEANVHSGSSDEANEGEVEGSSEAEGEQSDTADGGHESRSVHGDESDDDDMSAKVSGRRRKNGKDTNKGKAKASASKAKVKAAPKKRGQSSSAAELTPKIEPAWGATYTAGKKRPAPTPSTKATKKPRK